MTHDTTNIQITFPKTASLPVPVFELTSSQARLLGENLDAIIARSETGAVTDAERVRALDPIRPILAAAFAWLGRSQLPIVRLRGLPVDAVDRGRPLPHPTPRADAFLHGWTCAQQRQPMVYAESGPGQMFQDVFPRPDALDKPHAHGAAPIRWHIDGGGYPRDLVPDRMGLLGIENTTRIATELASTDAVLSALPPSMARLLSQPLYRYCLPSGRGGVDRNRFTPWLPLVTRSASGPSVSYMFPYVLPMPETGAAEALAALERAASERAIHVLVQRGDLIFWRNGPLMHRRGAIPASEGSIRWFKRVFALQVNRHNRAALGPDHVVRAEPALIEGLMNRYRTGE
jgi:hypothetical protein